MRVGDPDGYGLYGQVEEFDGRLVCHECGRMFVQLATHVYGAHGITAAEYREAHGLGRRTRLVASTGREHMREAYDRHRDEHLKALQEHRQPEAATRASLPTSRRDAWRPEVRAKRQRLAHARRGRPLTLEERHLLRDDLDLQAWADQARRILADPTVSTRSVAEACGITPPTVSQRLRRYPARG